MSGEEDALTITDPQKGGFLTTEKCKRFVFASELPFSDYIGGGRDSELSNAPLFPDDGPAHLEIKQGNLGNCYLISVLHSILSLNWGGQYIWNMMREAKMIDDDKFSYEDHRPFVTVSLEGGELCLQFPKIIPSETKQDYLLGFIPLFSTTQVIGSKVAGLVSTEPIWMNVLEVARGIYKVLERTGGTREMKSCIIESALHWIQLQERTNFKLSIGQFLSHYNPALFPQPVEVTAIFEEDLIGLLNVLRTISECKKDYSLCLKALRAAVKAFNGSPTKEFKMDDGSALVVNSLFDALPKCTKSVKLNTFREELTSGLTSEAFQMLFGGMTFTDKMLREDPSKSCESIMESAHKARESDVYTPMFGEDSTYSPCEKIIHDIIFVNLQTGRPMTAAVINKEPFSFPVHRIDTKLAAGLTEGGLVQGLYFPHGYSIVGAHQSQLNGKTYKFITVKNPHGRVGRTYCILRDGRWRRVRHESGISHIELSDFITDFNQFDMYQSDINNHEGKVLLEMKELKLDDNTIELPPPCEEGGGLLNMLWHHVGALTQPFAEVKIA